MKTFSAITVLTLAATPAFAADASTAFDAQISAEIGYQGNDNNFDERNFNGPTFALNGSVALPVSETIGIQADVSHSQDVMNFPIGQKVNNKATVFGAHLFARKSENFLVGLIGQVNFISLSTDGYSVDFNQYFAGGEAQMYLKNATFTAQVAYRKDDLSSLGFGEETFNQSGVLATAQGKLFITSNWSLAAKGEYSHTKFNSGYDVSMDQWRVGIISERRLPSVPISLFFKANYGETKIDTKIVSARLNEKRIVAGFKINFGLQSLKARDRSGASVEGFKVDTLFPFFF